MLSLPFVGLNSGMQFQLVADIGWDSAYTSTEAGSATQITVTFKRDGTWTITAGIGDVLGGTPTSGAWAASSSPANVGDFFAVQYAVANEVGSPVVTNNAATPTQISGDITVNLQKSGSNSNADITVTVIPLIGPASPLTEAANFAANGA